MQVPTDYSALQPLHRIAVLHTIDVVAGASPDDLALPTPCDGWTLRDLLAHMTVQHHGFAAAARGFGGDPENWDVSTVVDPLGTYADAARDAVDAFAAATGETPFALPEFGPEVVVPGVMAIGFHLVDYVVHGWDVAAAALAVALAVPDGEFRDAAESPFARAVDGASATDVDRVLRHLGRNPDRALSRTRP